MPWSATVWPPSRDRERLVHARIQRATAGSASSAVAIAAMCSRARAGRSRRSGVRAHDDLDDAHDEEERDAGQRGDEDRGPELLGAGDVLLVED